MIFNVTEDNKEDFKKIEQQIEELKNKDWIGLGQCPGVGIYGLPADKDLSQFKEILVHLIYDGSIVGSMVATMQAFEQYPLVVTAPIDSTYKQRLAKVVKKDNRNIQIYTFKNITTVHLCAR